jgi:hypothetical protein
MMPSRKTILESLTAHELRDALAAHGIASNDRRDRATMVDALSSSNVPLAEILTPLGRDRLKEICSDCGLSSSGREIAAIVKRLVDAAAPDSAQMPGGQADAANRAPDDAPVMLGQQSQVGRGIQVGGEGNQVSISVHQKDATASSAKSKSKDTNPSSWPALVWLWITKPYVLIPTVLLFVIALIAFKKMGVPCTQPNLTQQCYCSNGKTGAQTCREDLTWSPCVCLEGSSVDGGVPAPTPSTSSATPPERVEIRCGHQLITGLELGLQCK